MKISNLVKKIIVAASENNVIGKDGEIPWHYPEDLEHFKNETTGHSVIMGRKTFESLPDSFRPLPDRKNIVLTRSGVENCPEEVEEAQSLEEAWDIASEHSGTAYVIGGESVYRQSLEEVEEIILTRVHEEYDGDTFFPNIGEEWSEEEREKGEKLSFITFRRKS
ncbi:MAG: dihydrofolate reductase [Candidatus Nanosalina sp.]